jgi:hypothetical protein
MSPGPGKIAQMLRRRAQSRATTARRAAPSLAGNSAVLIGFGRNGDSSRTLMYGLSPSLLVFFHAAPTSQPVSVCTV